MREIERVEKTCSCIEAEASSTILQPRATAQVRVSLQVGDVRDLSRTKTNIFFKGFEQPLTLALTARARPRLRVIPRSLDFGQLAYEATKAITLRVHQSGEEAPELRQADAKLDAVRVEVNRKTTVPPHSWEVTVQLTGKDVTEPIESMLHLVRSDGEDLAIPVFARPAWGFLVRPARPVIVVDSEPGLARVTISSRDGLPFVNDGAQATESFASVEVPSSGAPALEHEVDLTIARRPSEVESRGVGEVALRIRHIGDDGAIETSLSVPFTYWFLDASRRD